MKRVKSLTNKSAVNFKPSRLFLPLAALFESRVRKLTVSLHEEGLVDNHDEDLSIVRTGIVSALMSVALCVGSLPPVLPHPASVPTARISCNYGKNGAPMRALCVPTFIVNFPTDTAAASGQGCGPSCQQLTSKDKNTERPTIRGRNPCI